MNSLQDMQSSRAQRGAATLVIVMVLFLVMALLAAYANRSLMFEQRISGSYYRASMSQELADGGQEWMLAMLNGTGIDDDCKAVNTGGTRFVDKYLNVSADDRKSTRLTTAALTAATADLIVDCASTGTTLVCRCPAPDTWTPPSTATAVAGELVPSFGANLGREPGDHFGNFLVQSWGCTDGNIGSCFGASGNTQARSQKAVAMALHKGYIAFVAAVPSSPAAPLTVKGALTTSGAGGLGLHNTDPRSAGVLVVSGGGAPVLHDQRMDSVPGTPPSQARIFNDSYLAGLNPTNADDKIRFFRTFMGMAPARYLNHPAARTVPCTANTDCGQALVDAFNAGKRMLTVGGTAGGSMLIGSNVVIGTAAAPVLIVVNGPVVIDGPMELNGMLVVLGDLIWTNTGTTPSQINGMVVVQGDMAAVGRMDISYQQSIANHLRNRLGSYARISGSWMDYNTLDF